MARGVYPANQPVTSAFGFPEKGPEVGMAGKTTHWVYTPMSNSGFNGRENITPSRLTLYPFFAFEVTLGKGKYLQRN